MDEAGSHGLRERARQAREGARGMSATDGHIPEERLNKNTKKRASPPSSQACL
jgi:hypothetical protein